jgi:hypothetical protein
MIYMCTPYQPTAARVYTSVPLSRVATHIGDTMGPQRLDVPTLSLRVDKLASCDALVFASVG